MNKKNQNLVKIILILGILYIISDSMKALLENQWYGNIFGLIVLPAFFYLFHKYFIKHNITVSFLKSLVSAIIIMVTVGIIHTGFDLIFFSDTIGRDDAYQMMLDDFYSGIAFGVIYYIFSFIRKQLKSRNKKQV